MDKENKPSGPGVGKLGKREPFLPLGMAACIYVCVTSSGWLSPSPEQMADSGGQPQLTQVSTAVLGEMGY